MKPLTLCAIAFWLISTCASAADQNGQFIMGGGVGGAVCPQFVSAMSEGRKAGIGSLGYVRATSAFELYLFGFETGYNLQAEDTCDIFGKFTADQLLAWLGNYCRAHPLEKFGSAVVALARDVHDKRLRTCQ